jgi:NAD(P)-dependent dehydrogenase (short-subunit alcohol dehydrogenase family)
LPTLAEGGVKDRRIASRAHGKVAIVTGAARGLGRAYVKRLAALVAKVAVADLNLRSREEFEPEAQDMTADNTVAKIDAAGGTALVGSHCPYTG